MSSPEGDIAAKCVRQHKLMGKARCHSKHDFRLAVSTTRTISWLTSSGPDIPKVVMVRRLSSKCWNLGTFLALNSNNLRCPSADNVSPRRGDGANGMGLKDPFS